MKNSFLICITCFNNSSIEQCALIILVTVQMQQVTPDFTLTHVLLAEIKVVGTPAHNPNKQTNKHYVLLFCPHLVHSLLAWNPGVGELVGEQGHHLLVAVVLSPELLVGHDNGVSLLWTELSHG